MDQPAEEVEAELEKEALRTACQRVEDLVSALEGYRRELPGGWEAWKQRFREVGALSAPPCLLNLSGNCYFT